MSYVNQKTNICDVYQLPLTTPKGFLHGGGRPVEFVLVDFFNPVPPPDLPEFGGTPKPWAEYEKELKPLMEERAYLKPGFRYILVTDFGESFVFQARQQGNTTDE